MARVSPKQRITAHVLDITPKELRPSPEITAVEILFKWWMTGRQAGLRLTTDGDQAFRLAKIECFDTAVPKVPNTDWYKFILDLNNKIPCPYFLSIKDGQMFLRVYDDKVAMLLALYGSVQEYLDSVHPKCK